MKNTLISGISVFLCLFIFPTSCIFAQNKTEKYLGKRVSCLALINLDKTKILDDHTILFELKKNEVYISRLPAQCPGLKIADAFSYSTSLNRLCKHDIIEVLEGSIGVNARCGLGEFVQLKGVKNLTEAVKLLIDEGLLESLVKEGAFETAFPAQGK